MKTRKTLDFIRENGIYMFIYQKPNLTVKYPVNGLELFVNDKKMMLKKPFANIVKFQHFCVETDLF